MADTRLRVLPDRERYSLRCAGTPPTWLPHRPLTSVVVDGRAALWLGPDEWLLLGAPPDQAEGLAVIDISHRHLGLALEGPGAAAALNEGCPLDLDPAAFPPGACTRTLFGKIEIILWRRSAGSFEIEVARSFAEPLRALLQQVVRDLAEDADPP